MINADADTDFDQNLFPPSNWDENYDALLRHATGTEIDSFVNKAATMTENAAAFVDAMRLKRLWNAWDCKEEDDCLRNALVRTCVSPCFSFEFLMFYCFEYFIAFRQPGSL